MQSVVAPTDLAKWSRFCTHTIRLLCLLRYSKGITDRLLTLISGREIDDPHPAADFAETIVG
jgi:hypothetical protein